jgi:hypothetical protein
MTNLPAFQFYPADWLNDIKLASCDLAAKGLMIDLMCLMHQSEKYGYLLINGLKPAHKTVAKVLRLHHKTFIKSFNTLLISGVLKTDSEGVVYCERMVKDQRLRDIRREVGKLGGNPNLVNQKVKQEANQKPTPSSSSSTSSLSLKKEPFIETSDEVRLSRLLLEKIVLEFPTHRFIKNPPSIQSWAKHIDLMIRRDGRSVEQIEYVVNWLYGDNLTGEITFEVQGTQSLRKKFDKIVSHLTRNRKGISHSKQDKAMKGTLDNMDAWLKKKGEEG